MKQTSSFIKRIFSFFYRLFERLVAQKTPTDNHYGGHHYGSSSALSRLGCLTLNHIRVPRSEMVAVPLGESHAHALRLMHNHRFHALPVFRDNLDHIVGVLHIHDVIRAQNEHTPWSTYIQPAFFVPETMEVWEGLKNLSLMHEPFLIVVDEHGVIDGLISPRTLLKAVVNAFDDVGQYARHDRSFLLDARTRLSELERILGFLPPHDNGIETIAGYIAWKVGSVPVENAIILLENGWRCVVIDRNDRRVIRVRIENMRNTA